MKMILFGAPGSGKGTQAKELSECYNINKISLGDILRKEVKKSSSLGNTVKGYMERGVLVPDDVVAKVIEENIGGESFILDGYPRNLDQAVYLDNILSKKNTALDIALYLDVDSQTIIKRLQMRRVCPKCGANYHLINMPPRKEGVCDLCGAELVQRKDDNPEVIKERINVFFKESKPLLGFYRDKNILISIDARNDKDKVFSEIEKVIQDGKYLKQ
ncbi:MAG: adenylate kinase [Candidatus Omnitrophica bacterium 4484_171]|nr:MAG: adenylate kinase [Candidatus Omnitrophica bacterium 4484_171]